MKDLEVTRRKPLCFWGEQRSEAEPALLSAFSLARFAPLILAACLWSSWPTEDIVTIAVLPGSLIRRVLCYSEVWVCWRKYIKAKVPVWLQATVFMNATLKESDFQTDLNLIETP